jgi:hypothetical protein
MIRSLTKKPLATKVSCAAFGFLVALGFMQKAGAASLRYEVDFDARYGVHTYGPPSIATHRHTVQFEQTAKFNEHWSAVLGFRAEGESAYASDPEKYGNTDVSKYDSQIFLPRDNYLQYKNGSIQLRAGYQQVVWGEAFGAYYADIVNPKDYREGGLGDLSRNRLDSPILNMQWIGESSSVQLLYIPVFTPSLLPKMGSDFSVTKLPDPYANVNVTLAQDPLAPPTRGEGGLRITKQIFDFDFSIFYLHYYDRFPVFRVVSQPSLLQVNVAPDYLPLQTAGLTVTSDFSGFLFRSEVLEHISRDVNVLTATGLDTVLANELVYVIGLDLPPWQKWQLSFQYSESRLTPTGTAAGTSPVWAFRQVTQPVATARIAKTFSNDLMIEALGTSFTNDKSTLLQAKVVIPMADQLELAIGADNFDGDPGSQLGRYKNASRAWVMLKAFLKK